MISTPTFRLEKVANDYSPTPTRTYTSAYAAAAVPSYFRQLSCAEGLGLLD